jgi:hypothetical protein
MPRRRRYAKSSPSTLRPYVTARESGATCHNVEIDTPLAALEDMALRLRRLKGAGLGSPIHSNLADWFSTAIERYLSQEVSSLDAALGLRARRGRRRKSATPDELRIGRAIFAIGIGGKSWKEIADELRWERDESSLRELWARISSDVVKSLSADPPESEPRKGSNTT